MKKIFLFVLSVLIVAVSFALIASAVSDNTTALQNDSLYGSYAYTKDGTQTSLPYRLHLPEGYDGKDDYPVMIVLHGYGSNGTNNTSQINSFLDVIPDEIFDNCIMIMPQCPSNTAWVNGILNAWSRENYILNDFDESAELSAVMGILKSVCNTYSVDEDKIYVSGCSMGGYGSWYLIEKYSDVFAGAYIFYGVGDTTMGSVLKDIPILTYHGTNDNVINIKSTNNMYDAINTANGNIGTEAVDGNVTTYTSGKLIYKKNQRYRPYRRTNGTVHWCRHLVARPKNLRP